MYGVGYLAPAVGPAADDGREVAYLNIQGHQLHPRHGDLWDTGAKDLRSWLAMARLDVHVQWLL